jgi:hypothetical protein
MQHISAACDSDLKRIVHDAMHVNCKIIVSSTPAGPQGIFYELWQHPDWYRVHHPGGLLGDELYDKSMEWVLKLNQSDRVIDHELDAKF